MLFLQKWNILNNPDVYPEEPWYCFTRKLMVVKVLRRCLKRICMCDMEQRYPLISLIMHTHTEHTHTPLSPSGCDLKVYELFEWWWSRRALMSVCMMQTGEETGQIETMIEGRERGVHARPSRPWPTQSLFSPGKQKPTDSIRKEICPTIVQNLIIQRD